MSLDPGRLDTWRPGQVWMSVQGPLFILHREATNLLLFSIPNIGQLFFLTPVAGGVWASLSGCRCSPSQWLRLSCVHRVCSQDLQQMFSIVFIFFPVLHAFSLDSLSPDPLILNSSSWCHSKLYIFPVCAPKHNFPDVRLPIWVTKPYPSLREARVVSLFIGLAQSNVCLFLGSPRSYMWLSSLLLRPHAALICDKIQPRELPI